MDQFTTMDSHPVNDTLPDEQCSPIDEQRDLGDSAPQTWMNVGFADYEYRADPTRPTG